MESFVIMCKYRADIASFKVNENMHFDDIVFMVCQEWSELSVGNVTLKYSVPGFDGCFLRNQSNWLCMLDLMKVFSLMIIQIDVSALAISYEKPTELVCSYPTPISCVYDQGGETSESSSSSNKRVLVGEKKVLLSDNWLSLINEVGQKFLGGAADFRRCLDKYLVRCGFHFHMDRNDNNRIHAFCHELGRKNHCSWSILATVNIRSGAFVIRELNNEHTCDLVVVKDLSKRLSSKRISELIEDEVRSCPSYNASDVIVLMRGSYGLHINYKKAYKAVKFARARLFGDGKNSFDELRWYVDAALIENPGIRIVLEVDDETKMFKCLFVSFAACIVGFQYIRPMLFIDGAHLSGKYKGTLMSATGKNGNNQLYPLAFAIVSGETKDNWIWFLEQLKEVIGQRFELTFTSDMNLSILAAVPTVFTEVDHYFCIYHLKENLKTRFSGPVLGVKRERMLDLFRDCAYATTKPLFNHYINLMKEEGGIPIQQFINDLHPKHWAEAWSGKCRYGSMASSAVESFNSWVLEYGGLPIVPLVDGIRTSLMKWYIERKEDSSRWTTVLCKGVAKIIHELMDKNRAWNRLRSSEYVFEVLTIPSFSINVAARSCSCGGWQVGGFPCDHALVCFPRSNLEIHDYIEDYFHTFMYRKAYEMPIYPVPTSARANVEFFAVEPILPPEIRIQPGRPPKARRKSANEKQKTNIRKFKCGNCGKMGNHNKRSCKNPSIRK